MQMYLQVEQAMETTVEIQEELFLSIRQRNIDRVKAILSNYPEVANIERIQDGQLGGSTPLLEACHCGEFSKYYL